jgi:hypothetical protein
VKDEDLVIGGAGTSRTVTITSVEPATGSTTITLTVLDELDQPTPATFTVDVVLDDPPTIAGQTIATTSRDTVLGPLTFTIGDDVVAPAALTFTASRRTPRWFGTRTSPSAAAARRAR